MHGLEVLAVIEPLHPTQTEPPNLVHLRQLAERGGIVALEVSRWSVGMQLQHSALAAIGICRALESSTPPPPRTWRSLIGRFVLWRGRLPRQRATAPPTTVPEIERSPPELRAMLDESIRCTERARALTAEAWFGHFALGTLRRDEALRFIDVHTAHHMRIVEDILEARAPV